MIRSNPKISLFASRINIVGKIFSVISAPKNYYISLIPILLLLTTTNFAQNQTNVKLNILGIKVTKRESIKINSKNEIKTALAFQFNDGSIAVAAKENLIWSYDGGHTWEEKDSNPIDKVMIDLGNGEILSVDRATHLKSNGKYSAQVNRSFDNWENVIREEVEVDIPQASYTTTGSGGRVDGLLFHHGIIRLDNGDLVATMYGNYEGDVELCDGYPPELNQRKYRTIVVFSKDKGRTWRNPVLVAYDKMLGRGIPADHKMVGKSIPSSRASKTSIVPAITMEGFREADLVQASNGDLVCVMRSGGRNPAPGLNLFPTPLYCSRSSDRGLHWTPPEQIADRGVCPSIILMSNGILVCTYSRPGNWLIFSDDNGKTWKGAFQFGTGNSSNYLVETKPGIIQVYHEVESDNGTELHGTFFQVEKR